MYRSNVDQFFLFMIYNKIKLLILLNDCIKSSNNLNIALLIFNYLLKVVELEYQVQYIFCNKTEGYNTIIISNLHSNQNIIQNYHLCF